MLPAELCKALFLTYLGTPLHLKIWTSAVNFHVFLLPSMLLEKSFSCALFNHFWYHNTYGPLFIKKGITWTDHWFVFRSRSEQFPAGFGQGALLFIKLLIHVFIDVFIDVSIDVFIEALFSSFRTSPRKHCQLTQVSLETVLVPLLPRLFVGALRTPKHTGFYTIGFLSAVISGFDNLVGQLGTQNFSWQWSRNGHKAIYLTLSIVKMAAKLRHTR